MRLSVFFLSDRIAYKHNFLDQTKCPGEYSEIPQPQELREVLKWSGYVTIDSLARCLNEFRLSQVDGGRNIKYLDLGNAEIGSRLVKITWYESENFQIVTSDVFKDLAENKSKRKDSHSNLSQSEIW